MIKTQIIIWTKETLTIGGIETFIYNFCTKMHDKYDIIVLYDVMDKEQIKRLRPYVNVVHYSNKEEYECETLLVNRIFDKIPTNISKKKMVRICHACKMYNNWVLPTDADEMVMVSQTAMDSWAECKKDKTTVIHNMTNDAEKPIKVLRLISAMRTTSEKGPDRVSRIAEQLEKAKIPFLWLIFTNKPLTQKIKNVVCLDPTLNIKDHIKHSDYLVSLSDIESFGYSIVESLELGVPVITTPISVLDELGFKDGENGFVIPFDLENIDWKKIYDADLHFTYKNDNEEISKKWDKVLNITTKAKGNYVFDPSSIVNVKIIHNYKDMELNRTVSTNEILEVPLSRAEQLESAGVGEIIS